VADVEDSESTEAIEIRAAGDVAIGVGSGIRPLHDGRRAVGIARLAVLEKARVDVLAERLDRLARDPIGLGRRDVRLLDEI
jgi:hypothetical protein